MPPCVTTSDDSSLDRSSGSFPGAASKLWMMRYAGDRPSRTVELQPTAPAATAASDTVANLRMIEVVMACYPCASS